MLRWKLKSSVRQIELHVPMKYSSGNTREVLGARLDGGRRFQGGVVELSVISVLKPYDFMRSLGDRMENEPAEESSHEEFQWRGGRQMKRFTLWKEGNQLDDRIAKTCGGWGGE